MAKKKQRKTIRPESLVDALVWHCPRYSRDGIFSCCIDPGDGSRSNCVKGYCSRVFDIFKTIAQIENKEITVF